VSSSGAQGGSVWRRLVTALGPRAMLHAARVYPPFLGAGIRVTHADPGLRSLTVEMPLRPWTRNYVGTHFGGSLYMMCDPFFMIMVMENLGRGYVVWDRSAEITFLRPGRSRVRAEFRVTEEELEAIRAAVARDGRAAPRFEVTVTDAAGEAVARVRKELSVRVNPGRSSGPV